MYTLDSDEWRAPSDSLHEQMLKGTSAYTRVNFRLKLPNILNRFYQTFSINHSFYYPWLLISENDKDSSAPVIGTLDTQNTFLILEPLHINFFHLKGLVVLVLHQLKTDSLFDTRSPHLFLMIGFQAMVSFCLYI